MDHFHFNATLMALPILRLASDMCLHLAKETVYAVISHVTRILFSLEARSREQEAGIAAAHQKQLTGAKNFWLLAAGSPSPAAFWRDINGAALG